MHKISIAIPTYNSSEFIGNTFKYVLNDSRIDEIVINDDGSFDFDDLKAVVDSFQSKKIKIFSNEVNKKAFENKAIAVEKCSNKWVVLLDSDNIITKNYIDTIYSLVWDSNTIYCPSDAKPLLDYTCFAGQTVHKGNLADFVKHKKAFAMLNDGNFFFRRDSYLRAFNEMPKDSYLSILDVLYFNTHWILQKNTIEIVDNLSYFHRHHKNSFFMKNKEKSADIIATIHKKISPDYERVKQNQHIWKKIKYKIWTIVNFVKYNYFVFFKRYKHI